MFLQKRLTNGRQFASGVTSLRSSRPCLRGLAFNIRFRVATTITSAPSECYGNAAHCGEHNRCCCDGDIPEHTAVAAQRDNNNNNNHTTPTSSGDVYIKKKIAFDFLEDNLDHPYIREFWQLPYAHELRKNPKFRSLLNHKTLKKEITETYAMYMQVQKLIQRLEAVSNRRFIATNSHKYIPQPDEKEKAAAAAAAVAAATTKSNNGDSNNSNDVITEDQLVFFDVCSGKGYNSFMLSHFYPKAKFYLFDNDSTINMSHVDGLSTLTYLRCDILRVVSEKEKRSGKAIPPTFAEIVRDMLLPDPVTGKEKIGIMMGMHLCGPLSTKFIEVYNTTEKVKGMILAPCCLDNRQKQFIEKAREVCSANIANTPTTASFKTAIENYAHERWCDALLRWTGAQDGEEFSVAAAASLSANDDADDDDAQIRINNSAAAAAATTTKTASGVVKFMTSDKLCLSPKNDFIVSHKSML